MRTHANRATYAFVSFILFWRMVFSEYFSNHCLTRSSALAFGLLLTLIPVMALTSFFLSSAIEVHPEEIERFFKIFLPYAPSALLDYIRLFFVNAEKVRGTGILVLIIVSIGLFGTIEEAMNAIWRVSQSRSFYVRLRTFTMVMVYSPVLFIASFQVRIWVQSLHTPFVPYDAVPFLLNVLAFTTLVWFVPNTKVKFRNAFIGGLAAALLYEIERQGFSSYVRFSFQTQEIYGTFGIVVFFLISLFFTAVFILFGAEVAYVLQQFRPLLRSRRRGERRVANHATYLGLRMLIDIISAFRNRIQPPTLKQFEKRYELTDVQVNGILKILIQASLVHRVNEHDAFVPALDFSQRKVAEALDVFEDQNRQIPAVPNDSTRAQITRLMETLRMHSGTVLETLTFDQLLVVLNDANTRAEKFKAL